MFVIADLDRERVRTCSNDVFSRVRTDRHEQQRPPIAGGLFHFHLAGIDRLQKKIDSTTMMNIDVTARLIDGVTRPARDATESIERFGNAAQRIARRVAGLAGASKSFASAVRELRAADTALDRATGSSRRLRGAMTNIAPASRASAAGLGIATRALEKYASATSRAATATDRLRTGIERPTAESFVDRANTALREQVRLLNDAARLSNRLANAGGNGRGGRRGMGGANGGGERVPGVMLGFQPDLHALRGVYEQATSLQDAIIRMHGMGLSDTEIARVRFKADEVSKANKSTTPLRVLNSIMEARTATGGNLDESIKLAPELANAEQVLTRFLPKEAAAKAHEQLYDLVRAGELRNEIGDPAKLHRMFESMLATAVYTQGRVGPRDQHKNILYGRGASQGWSDDFANDRLPFFVQELKTGPNGGQAGVALQSLFKNVALGVRSKKANAEWSRIGMLGSDGEIVGANEGISDPDRFLARVHSNMIKTGITGHEDQVKEYGKLFGTGTGQTAAMIGGFQQDRLASYERSRKTIVDSQGLVDLANQTLSQSSDNLKASFETLEGNVGSMLTPTMTMLADAATLAVRGINRFASPFGKNGNDPAGNTGGESSAAMFGAGSAAAGALLGAGWLFRRFPFLGKVAAGGAGWAATQNPAGVALGPTIESGIKGLMSRLPAAAEAGLISGLKGGFIGGAFLSLGEYAIDKLVSALPKPKMTPEKQAAFEKHQRRWDDAWIWQKPGLIWEDAFGEHQTTANVAGKRASGGSVHSGSTYLVGERGPELFTPGVAGGISTNSFMGRMSRMGGDEAMPHAIRALSFALVSAVEGIARSLDRLRAAVPSHDDSGDESVSGAGTGSHISGGRHGFAARGGHFGGRRGFSTRQFGTRDESLPDTANTGPHVGLGRMAGGRSRGTFAKFDSKAPAIMGALMTKYGLTREQAAGVVGNLGHESARFTAYHEGGKASASGGVGWAQWTGSRRHAFERWTAAHGLNPTSDEASWRFLTEGDPETARAIAAVKKTHTADAAVRAFHDLFERSADIDRGGNIVKWKNWNSRLDLAHRAGGMNPVAGTSDPSDRVPEVLREQAKQQQAERERARSREPEAKAGSREGMVVHVTNHIHPGPGHDEKRIASAVHEHFNRAVNTQLNDGAFA